MKRRRLLAAILLPVAAATVVWGLATGKPAAVRWGANGHRMATRAAHTIMPDRMPTFFAEAGPQLVYLSPEPDRWYNRDLQEMDEAWRYDHFIDLENVPRSALDASDRFEFLTALFDEGIRRPQQTVGLLPFRIMELYQRLATGFAQWRVAPQGSNRDWIEDRIINDAGILGHYVLDASNPHHTTIHFNGWAEGTPNPRGFTSDRGFHSLFESAFVGEHVAYEDLPPLLPSAPERLRNPREAVWEQIRASNATVERLYELEKEYGFDPDRPPHPEALRFTHERLAAGAEMLAAIWWTAWLESDDLAEDRRARR